MSHKIISKTEYEKLINTKSGMDWMILNGVTVSTIKNTAEYELDEMYENHIDRMIVERSE